MNKESIELCTECGKNEAVFYYGDEDDPKLCFDCNEYHEKERMQKIDDETWQLIANGHDLYEPPKTDNDGK